jgi:hypothetical protein
MLALEIADHHFPEPPRLERPALPQELRPGVSERASGLLEAPPGGEGEGWRPGEERVRRAERRLRWSSGFRVEDWGSGVGGWELGVGGWGLGVGVFGCRVGVLGFRGSGFRLGEGVARLQAPLLDTKLFFSVVGLF